MWGVPPMMTQRTNHVDDCRERHPQNHPYPHSRPEKQDSSRKPLTFDNVANRCFSRAKTPSFWGARATPQLTQIGWSPEPAEGFGLSADFQGDAKPARQVIDAVSPQRGKRERAATKERRRQAERREGRCARRRSRPRQGMSAHARTWSSPAHRETPKT